jgi:tetratricopeptide (TPR) repeat protein
LVAQCSTREPNVSTHFLLAALLKAAGETDKTTEHQTALSWLMKEREAGRTGNASDQAEHLCQSRRYAACVQALASKSQLDAAGYLLLGKARIALLQFETASDAFAASFALTSNSAEVIYHLARSYEVLANQCFTRLQELAPHCWRAHQMRAEAHKLRFEDDEAMREYERAAQLRPEAPELYEELAALYLPNDVAVARAALEKALKLEPSRARALYLLGRMYVTGREEQKAIPYLQKALRYDANLLEARADLGKAYLRAGRPDAAVTELEKALSLDFYGDLHYLLYRAYRDLGKTDQARAALSQSEAMRKKSVERDRDKLERWMKE